VKVRIEYRAINYKLSDAFHRNPNHRKRIFLVDTKDMGTENIEAIAEAAKDSAPEGYKFFQCRAL